MAISEFLSVMIIAIVQGATEWLPVSSSGHIILFERILDFDGGLLFSVALHFGTLMAVFVYFGGDVIDIIRDFLLGKFNSTRGRMGLLLIIASIPAAIAGFFFGKIFEVAFTNLTITALGFAITALFLFIVSIQNNKKFLSHQLSSTKSLLIGTAQVFSLFPGISRSGATIGTGILAGLREKEAVKFSFLMSIPIIFGANILTVGNSSLPSSFILATLISFVTGLATIHVLYRKILVNKKNLRWFAAYALILSAVLFVLSLN